MIVRINQIDPGGAEQQTGWPSSGLAGPVRYAWPPDARAYEVLILGQDEQNRPLPDTFRQEQLRKVIPVAAAALAAPGEALVLRLDGPLAERELFAALRYLVDRGGTTRFATSSFAKLEPGPAQIIGSVRVQPSAAVCAALCTDAEVGLERSVRLRAFSLPEPLVAPMLDIEAPDDERWQQVLSQCGFALSTSAGLQSLQIRSRRFEPAEVRSRLMRGLLAVAQGK